MSKFGPLAAKDGSVTAPTDAITAYDSAVAIPGWAQQTTFTTKDGTCTNANAEGRMLRPLGFCFNEEEGATRWRCDGTTMVQDSWKDSHYNNCDNDGAHKDGASKTLYPECGEGVDKFDIRELDTCRLSSQREGRIYYGVDSESNEVDCTEITLANADSIFACYALCTAEFDGGNGTCKRVGYKPATKKCTGYTDECNREDSSDEDAEGTIIAADWGSEVLWKVGCAAGVDPAPGGVIQYFYKEGDATITTALCGASKSDGVMLNEYFFVFDKCEAGGADTSYATYCVNDKVIHSKWEGDATCTGAPAKSWEFAKDTCVLADGNGDAKKSYKVDWWGKCGGSATIKLAGLEGADATCTQPDPVDPACVCDSGVGLIDAAWNSDDGTCGQATAKHSCVDLKGYFSDASNKAIKDAWNEKCCDVAGASSATTSFALVGTLLALVFRKFL